MTRQVHEARADDDAPLHGLRGGPRGPQYGLVNVNIDLGANKMPFMLAVIAGVGLIAFNFERVNKLYAQALAHPDQSFAAALILGALVVVGLGLWLVWRVTRWVFGFGKDAKRSPASIGKMNSSVIQSGAVPAAVVTSAPKPPASAPTTFLPPHVLKAASIGTSPPTAPTPDGGGRHVVHSPTRTYEIVRKLGETAVCSFYLVREDGKASDLVLKVSRTVEHNAVLDREAALLRDLKDASDRIEVDYAKTNPGPQKLNYQFCFPILVESFVSDSQGGRRVTVVRFDGVEDFSKLSALGHIAARERTRIDPKTSAWIMGKLLKIIAFAHDQGIGIGALDGDNIMIDRAEHFVLVFDWTGARHFDPAIPQETAAAEIADAARAVIGALGGDPATGTLLASDQIEDGRYADIFGRMVSGRESDAFALHGEFYGLIRELWPRRGFHPYTAYPLT